MKNNILKISIIALIFSLFGCEEEISNEMSLDYPQNYDITYQLRQVLQYDPMNINGIDLSQKLAFFNSLRFTLQYNDGKLTKVTYSNGEVPFLPFNFETDSEFEADCEIDYDVLPNELRISGTDKVIAYYQNGEFVMPFSLDCGSLSYKYTFVNVQ